MRWKVHRVSAREVVSEPGFVRFEGGQEKEDEI